MSDPCNSCLRPIDPDDDPDNGLCGPCHRGESPESECPPDCPDCKADRRYSE